MVLHQSRNEFLSRRSFRYVLLHGRAQLQFEMKSAADRDGLLLWQHQRERTPQTTKKEASPSNEQVGSCNIQQSGQLFDTDLRRSSAICIWARLELLR